MDKETSPIRQSLTPVLEGKPLSRSEAREAMGLIMDGRATQAQIGAFLAALKVRGETEDELVGMALAMRERALRVEVSKRPLIDTCGTGGDGSGTFNISTAAALIAAGAGTFVAKHGNRSVSSRCGSADVLEALGVRTDLPPEGAARCVEEAGVGFLFAPSLHAAMRHAAPVRKELGVRTVFNLLGPLANPAGARRQLLGVYSPALVPVLARVLRELGSEEALVVSSKDGLDELSVGAPTAAAHLRRGRIRRLTIDARTLGLPRRAKSLLVGGDAAKNAGILLSVLHGEAGPARDVSLLNAAAALLVAGLAEDLREGLKLAEESVDQGRALHALERLKELSRSC